MRLSKLTMWIPVLGILTFLFAPVIVVVLFSFNSVPSTSLPLKGLTLHWYEQVLQDEEFHAAARNSGIVAAVTVAFSVTVGTAAAFAMSRRSSRLLTAASTLVVTPLVLPGLFVGVSLLLFATEIGLQPSLGLVFVGHALITIPFVVLVIGARLENFDRSVVEAARDLGANAPQAFFRVVLPSIAPAIVGAALLTLAWSFDEFIITLFTNGGDATVPVLIFARARLGLDPSINAIASFVLLATILATGVASRFLVPSKVAQ